MRILLLNQTFYPDVVATAQYLTQLAIGLVARGHTVTVVTGQRGYDQQHQLFLKRETWRRVEIYRIGSTHFGKTSKWRRAIDFATFLVNCAWRVLILPRHDVVVALTSPPLISMLGAIVASLKSSRFFYWIMDLNPDEAVAAGWLREHSLLTRLLESVSRFSMRRAAQIVVLDRFVRDRVLAKGVAGEKIVVIPTWSVDDAVHFAANARQRFRAEHALQGKFVVMYSGNHSPCHPLDTLLRAAQRLVRDSNIEFLFVGGGSLWGRVKDFADRYGLCNVKCLGYQPLEQLPASLSAADLHVVVMGEPFVGIIHPCKIYNILTIYRTARPGKPGVDVVPGLARTRPASEAAGVAGKGRAAEASPQFRPSPAILYIGPHVSHVSELLHSAADPDDWGWAQHGDVEGVVRVIEHQGRRKAKEWEEGCGAKQRQEPKPGKQPGLGGELGRIKSFSKDVLLPQMIALIEGPEPRSGASALTRKQ